MKKIYTKTGDSGTTGIYGGLRVPKDDIRIETNGCVDELNSEIGIVRTMMDEKDERQSILYEIQNELMSMMSIIATPSEIRDKNKNTFDKEITERCESCMDKMMSEMTDNGWFILPGGTPVAAHFQMARTIARRAERRMCTLDRKDPLPESIKIFMNRLSDLFFVMARYELHISNLPEEKWKEFCYKSKK